MPDWTKQIRAHLASLRLQPGREAEILEELAQHLEQRYDELKSEGASEAQAERLALAELRQPDVIAEFMLPLRQANVPPPLTPMALTVGRPR